MSQPPSELEINRRRDVIDALDRELLRLLNERAAHAKIIGTLKGDTAAYRPEREAQVLRAMRAENPGPLPDGAVTSVFRQIMSACLALEQQLRISYLGPAGTFSHAAVTKHFGDLVDAEPCASRCFEPPRQVGPTTQWCRSRIRPRARSAERWT